MVIYNFTRLKSKKTKKDKISCKQPNASAYCSSWSASAASLSVDLASRPLCHFSLGLFSLASQTLQPCPLLLFPSVLDSAIVFSALLREPAFSFTFQLLLLHFQALLLNPLLQLRFSLHITHDGGHKISWFSSAVARIAWLLARWWAFA